MSVRRIDLMNYVFDSGSTPNSEDFKSFMEIFLWEKFPNTTQKSIDNIVHGYIYHQIKTKWSQAYEVKSTLLNSKKHKKFFSEIISLEDSNGAVNKPEPIQEENVKNEITWDLSDISKFQYYKCPEALCKYECQDRTLFKEHMIKLHNVLKGSEKTSTEKFEFIPTESFVNKHALEYMKNKNENAYQILKDLLKYPNELGNLLYNFLNKKGYDLSIKTLIQIQSDSDCSNKTLIVLAQSLNREGFTTEPGLY